jgi:hypothetical protein
MRCASAWAQCLPCHMATQLNAVLHFAQVSAANREIMHVISMLVAYLVLLCWQ